MEVAVGDDVCCCRRRRRVLIMGDEKGIPFDTLIPLKFQLNGTNRSFLDGLTLLYLCVAVRFFKGGGGLILLFLLHLGTCSCLRVFCGCMTWAQCTGEQTSSSTKPTRPPRSPVR